MADFGNEFRDTTLAGVTKTPLNTTHVKVKCEPRGAQWQNLVVTGNLKVPIRSAMVAWEYKDKKGNIVSQRGFWSGEAGEWNLINYEYFPGYGTMQTYPAIDADWMYNYVKAHETKRIQVWVNYDDELSRWIDQVIMTPGQCCCQKALKYYNALRDLYFVEAWEANAQITVIVSIRILTQRSPSPPRQLPKRYSREPRPDWRYKKPK